MDAMVSLIFINEKVNKNRTEHRKKKSDVLKMPCLFDQSSQNPTYPVQFEEKKSSKSQEKFQIIKHFCTLIDWTKIKKVLFLHEGKWDI